MLHETYVFTGNPRTEKTALSAGARKIVCGGTNLSRARAGRNQQSESCLQAVHFPLLRFFARPYRLYAFRPSSWHYTGWSAPSYAERATIFEKETLTRAGRTLISCFCLSRASIVCLHRQRLWRQTAAWHCVPLFAPCGGMHATLLCGQRLSFYALLS
jgi:hypothetical protein